MFTWGDFHDLVGVRIRRLGVDDDALDLLMSGYLLLQQYVDTYDLTAYTVQNDAMFVTQAAQRTYPLPEDFGRFLHSTEGRRQAHASGGSLGIQLYGQATETPMPLTYREPLLFRQRRSATVGRPQYFTLGQAGGQRVLVLDPPPDANAGVDYHGEGVYLARIERPDLEQVILLDEPTVLVSGVLAQVAQDRGMPQATLLMAEYRALLSALVNNEKRKSAEYYQLPWPVSRGGAR